MSFENPKITILQVKDIKCPKCKVLIGKYTPKLHHLKVFESGHSIVEMDIIMQELGKENFKLGCYCDNCGTGFIVEFSI